MKKKLFTIFMLTMSFFSLSFAKVITVDNKYPYPADYKTLQEAHDNANDGDDIYLSPSPIKYNGINVTKRLNIYGVGFEITDYIGEPFTQTAMITGTIIFNANSEGSTIIGVDGNFNIHIHTENITVKRCSIYKIEITEDGAHNGSGSSIVQNKIISGGAAINMDNSISNILIYNNYFECNWNTCIFVQSYATVQDISIYNNVFAGTSTKIPSIIYSRFINNIIVHGSSGSPNGTIFNYNMSHGDLPEGYRNLTNVDMSTVFEENSYHLKADSPAKGSGENGADMGMYGGDMPFVDGGFPALPSILQIEAPKIGSKSGGIEVKFNVKSNN